MSSDEENSDDGTAEVFREDMRVFLRLRPMNKLEQSRRSKNCVELHEDTTVLTVDSPLEGEYDFVFDHVSPIHLFSFLEQPGSFLVQVETVIFDLMYCPISSVFFFSFNVVRRSSSPTGMPTMETGVERR